LGERVAKKFDEDPTDDDEVFVSFCNHHNFDLFCCFLFLGVAPSRYVDFGWDIPCSCLAICTHQRCSFQG